MVKQDAQGTPGDEGGASFSEALRKAQAAMSSEPDPGTGDAGESGKTTTQDGPTKVLSGKVKVDWGGTTREVDAAELVKAAMEREKVDAARAAIDDTLRKHAGLESLGKFVENLDAKKKQAFSQILRDPEVLDRLVGGDDDDETGDDESVDMEGLAKMLTGAKGKGGKANPLNELVNRIQQQEAALQKVMEWAVGKAKQEAEQSIDQKVEAAMGTFDVFKELPEGRRIAKQTILMQVAQNPDIDVASAVAKTAVEWHKMVEQARRSAMERVEAGVGPGDVIQLEKPDKPLSGDALMRGEVAKAAARAYGKFRV